jgi:rhomboid protease GluP
VSYGLIGANLAAYALELLHGGAVSGPGLREMIALGANYGPLTCGGEPWRLVTSMFLHFGLIHLAMNMICLYQVRIVERMLGRAEFLALYLASGLVAGLSSLLVHPYTVSAGASGAVFGMFGAFSAVMVVRRDRMDPRAWNQTMRSLGTFFALNLVLGLSSRGIDLAAHIGGLVGGFAGGFALAKTATARPRHLLRAAIVAGVGATVAFGGLRLISTRHDVDSSTTLVLDARRTCDAKLLADQADAGREGLSTLPAHVR